jgi:autotransporter passenger strand-loop-strand repeat protein
LRDAFTRCGDRPYVRALGRLAIATLVDQAATLTFSSGGTADATMVSGAEVLSAGGIDFGAVILGGVQDVFGVAASAMTLAGAQVREG